MTKFTIRVAKAADVDTHLHALRHFSATQAIAAGFDAVTVSARLGHADPSITLRVYSHALESRDRDLAASLGRMLAPPVMPQAAESALRRLERLHLSFVDDGVCHPPRQARMANL